MSTDIIVIENPTVAKTLSVMDPETLESRQKIRDYLQAGEAANLLVNWDLGAEVDRLMELQSSLGEQVVEKIAASLVAEGFTYLKATRLYDARDVYKCWPDRSVVEGYAQQGKIQYQHLVEVKRIQAEPAREKMLVKVLNKNLSAKETRLEIQGKGIKTKRASKSGDRDGRPVKMPTSTAAGLKQMTAFVTKGRNLNGAVWDGYVVPRLDKMSDSSLTHKLMLDIESLIKNWEEFVSSQRVTVGELRKFYKHCKTKLGNSPPEPQPSAKTKGKPVKKKGAVA